MYATPPRAQLRTFKPSNKERKVIHDGVAFLSMTTPFWSSLFYQLELAYSNDVDFAATDAHSVFVNPQAMLDAGWSIANVAFVMAHEVMHYILSDLIMGMGWRAANRVPLPDGTSLPYDHGMMNVAMDYRINAALIEGKVGQMPAVGCFDPFYSARGMESCVEIYAKMWKQNDSGQGKGFDEHIEPGQQQVEEEKGNAPQRRAQAIASAIQTAEQAGMSDVPEAVKLLIGEMLDPSVSWNDHLRSTMQRAAGTPGHDWTKLNKRLISRPDRIVFARRTSYGCGTIVVAGDRSGSCTDEKVLNRFFTEMNAIVTDLNPAELIVIWCDNKINRVDELSEPSDLLNYRKVLNDDGGPGGGGGTSFVPVFEHIKTEGIEPDMVVYLTDCLGTFPLVEPDYPVIWASTFEHARVPFGTLVNVEL